jgi:hypothetical protein
MDVAIRLVDLSAMHPCLLWETIITATVAVLEETQRQSPYAFALAIQDV